MMSDGLPCDYRHAVEAELPSGPAFQPFHCPVAAGALFDRLRDLFPTVPLRRYARGRVVETAGTPFRSAAAGRPGASSPPASST